MHPWSNPLKKSIPWDPDPSKVDYNSIMFDHFLPSVVGNAGVLDAFLSDLQCGYFEMVVNNKIKFNCSNDKDPDKLVGCSVIQFYYYLFVDTV